MNNDSPKFSAFYEMCIRLYVWYKMQQFAAQDDFEKLMKELRK